MPFVCGAPGRAEEAACNPGRLAVHGRVLVRGRSFDDIQDFAARSTNVLFPPTAPMQLLAPLRQVRRACKRPMTESSVNTRPDVIEVAYALPCDWRFARCFEGEVVH